KFCNFAAGHARGKGELVGSGADFVTYQRSARRCENGCVRRSGGDASDHGVGWPTHSGPSGRQVMPGSSGGGSPADLGVTTILRPVARAWATSASVAVVATSTFGW